MQMYFFLISTKNRQQLFIHWNTNIKWWN